MNTISGIGATLSTQSTKPSLKNNRNEIFFRLRVIYT